MRTVGKIEYRSRGSGGGAGGDAGAPCELYQNRGTVQNSDSEFAAGAIATVENRRCVTKIDTSDFARVSSGPKRNPGTAKIARMIGQGRKS